MSRVCVFLATGFEETEALAPVDLLRRAGVDTDIVSVTGEKTVTSSHGVRVTADKLLAEVDFDRVDMMVLPGGMPGTLNLEACEELMARLDEFYKKGKYISAICAAPSILGHRGMLKGKKACCFPEYESHLEGAEVTKNSVEVSNNITTSRGMGKSIDFGLSLVARFKGQEAADALERKIVYGKVQ